MSNKKLFNNPAWLKFERDIRERVIPEMVDSGSVLMIAPDISDKFDVQFAVQIGAAILMEKPLVLVVTGQRTIPPKLERIADRIIHADISTKEGRDAVEYQMKQFLTDYGRQ